MNAVEMLDMNRRRLPLAAKDKRMQKGKYYAALYLRLSRDDEKRGESVSIDYQRQILMDYADQHGYIVYDEYVDDGISGPRFCAATSSE